MENEKFIRVRYLRALEKFALNVIKALKRSDFDEEKFLSLVEKNFALLEKTPSIILYDSYPKALQNFVNIVLETKFDVQNKLLKAANALDKFKKAREYKRQNLKKDSYD